MHTSTSSPRTTPYISLHTADGIAQHCNHHHATRSHDVTHDLCMRFSHSTSSFPMLYSQEVTAHTALFHAPKQNTRALYPYKADVACVEMHTQCHTQQHWHPTIDIYSGHQAKFCLIRPYNRGTTRAPRVGSSTPDALSP